MSRPASPFRQEALDFRTGLDAAREGDTSPRIDPPWTRWMYWAVLVLTVAGVVATLLVRSQETTSGPARVDTDAMTFVAVVPDAAGSALRRGTRVRLDPAHADADSLGGTVVEVTTADAATVRAEGLSPPSGPMTLLRGVVDGEAAELSSGSAPAVEARAVVELRSGTVWDLLTRQGSGMLGGG